MTSKGKLLVYELGVLVLHLSVLENHSTLTLTLALAPFVLLTLACAFLGIMLAINPAEVIRAVYKHYPKSVEAGIRKANANRGIY